jgi:hypothetical protein
MADPLAAQYDLQGLRAADLAERKAQTRSTGAAGQKQPAAAPPPSQANRIMRRNLLNDRIDRYMVGAISGAVTAILTFLWFNLKLFWGQLLTRGQSRYIAPPSWRFLKVPILPDITASAAIILVDLLVLTVLMIMYAFWFMMLSIIAIGLTSYAQAIKMLFSGLGSLLSSFVP